MVLDQTEYDAKVNNLLSDRETYELLKKDPTSGYKRKISQKLLSLEQSGAISHDLKRKLHPTSESVPCFYGLPKIHKTDIPLRPIVSSIDSVTYDIAKHVASLLSPVVGKSVHCVENTYDFIDKVRKIRIEEDETMVSYDVKSLFTCIPPEEAINIVREKLFADPTLVHRTKLSIADICDLLRLCLDSTYFVYNGKFFRQKHGCAMGSPVSPIVANLYMEDFEERALRWYTGTKPKLWVRYVDDTFVVIKKSELTSFFDYINSRDQFITFTQELISDASSLPFLDVLVSVDDSGEIHCKVYRKPTHTDQYLSFDSHHPLVHKYGVVRSLNNRANQIITDEKDRESEREHLDTALSSCGYPRWAINNALKNKPRAENRPKPLTRISFPYVKGLSEGLQRICGAHGITVAHKPGNTLRQRLVHPKDAPPKDKISGVVYCIKCGGENCVEHYVGETEQPLKKRLYQHRHNAGEGISSAVCRHLRDCNHEFSNNDDVEILSKEKNWFNRGVKEAIFIKSLNPSLNRQGGGRFLLSSAWDCNLRQISRDHSRKQQNPRQNITPSHLVEGDGRSPRI